MVVVVVCLLLIGAALLIAWGSDRRDRRSGNTSFRTDRDMSRATRIGRREARWRRAQLDREIRPPDHLDDGD